MEAKEYKGHLLPYDLYYLIISYANISKWYLNNKLVVVESYRPPKEVDTLTKEDLSRLIQEAIKYNTDKVIYK